MVDQLPTLLANAAKKEKDSLWTTVNRLIDGGTSIETNGTCLRRALEYQKRFDLSQQDSIIYSAIITGMQHRPFTEMKCFISTNYKDFKDPGIISELNSYNCRYEQSFGKGLNFIKGRLLPLSFNQMDVGVQCIAPVGGWLAPQAGAMHCALTHLQETTLPAG